MNARTILAADGLPRRLFTVKEVERMVEVGLIEEEPSPEEDPDGVPWYDPPPWFAATYSLTCPPSDEPPF